MEPRLIEVIHNRTVNLKGGLGHNVAMDRVCEFLNAEFKGNPKYHKTSNSNDCFCYVIIGLSVM